MHVTFVYLDVATGEPNKFHHGIASMSAVLKKAGHAVSLLHLGKMPSRQQLVRHLKETKPDLIGFSATTNQYRYVPLLSQWIKEEFAVPIICGGLHPTVAPAEVLTEPAIDMVCIGEGEHSMLRLVEALEAGNDITQISNLWLKSGGRTYKNPVEPPPQGLDSLPFPDRDLFDHSWPPAHHRSGGAGRTVDVLTGRGCPFNCTYCCNHSLRNLYGKGGGYVRRRSVDNVIQELRTIVAQYKVDTVHFQDDLFAMHREWTAEFCEKYSREFSQPFVCGTRPELVNEEMASSLKKAGCIEIAMGIETGNESLRRTVLKRQLSDDEIRRAFRIAREHGIKTRSYNMVGLPYETVDMFEETLRLNESIDPDWVQVSIFYPYPGTNLYELCKKNGWLTEEVKSSYLEGSVLNQPSMSKEDTWRCYRRLRIVSLQHALRSRSPMLHSLYRVMSRLLGESLTFRVSAMGMKLYSLGQD